MLTKILDNGKLARNNNFILRIEFYRAAELSEKLKDEPISPYQETTKAISLALSFYADKRF